MTRKVGSVIHQAGARWNWGACVAIVSLFVGGFATADAALRSTAAVMHEEEPESPGPLDACTKAWLEYQKCIVSGQAGCRPPNC